MFSVLTRISQDKLNIAYLISLNREIYSYYRIFMHTCLYNYTLVTSSITLDYNFLFNIKGSIRAEEAKKSIRFKIFINILINVDTYMLQFRIQYLIANSFSIVYIRSTDR